MFLRYGVLAVALIAIVSGVIGLVVGGLVAVTGTALDVFAQPSKDALEAAGGIALIVAGLSVMIVGVFQIIFGIGMWRLSVWAWVAGVIIQSFSLVTALLGLFTGAAIPASLLTILISGGMLAFLLTPRVRKVFARRRAGASTTAAIQGTMVNH
ncbi:MAG TPA: hypothetical protein VF808_07635 [Ktedonobacterales bacterium]